MNGIILALVWSAPPNFSADVLRAIQTSNRAAGVSATVLETIRTSSGSRTLRFSVDFKRPSTVLFRQEEPASKERDAIKLTTFVEGNRATLVDYVTNEFTVRDVPAVGTTSQRLVLALQTIPDPIKVLLDPEVMSGMLKPLSQLKGWQSDRPGSWTLTQLRKDKKKLQTKVKFDEGFRLASITFQQPGKELDWKFEYRPVPQKISFALPKNALRVDSFLLRKPLPRAVDATSQSTLRKAVAFFDRIRHGQISAITAGGRTKITFSMEKMREDGPDSRWSYVGRKLTALVGNKRIGLLRNAGKANLANHLGRIGIGMHPMSRRLMMRENMIRQMIPDDAKVSSMGELTIQGVPCVVLQSRSPRLEINLSIRKSDGALLDVQTKTIDQNGRPVTTSSSQFAYKNLGKPVPTSAFAITIPKSYRRL